MTISSFGIERLVVIAIEPNSHSTMCSLKVKKLLTGSLLIFFVGLMFGQTSATKEIETPEQIVLQYIKALGERDFKKAYSYLGTKKWGSETHFSSSKSHGLITMTQILENPTLKKCTDKEDDQCVKAKVFVKYYAKNPTHDRRICKQAGLVYEHNFWLKRLNDHWKIVDGSLDDYWCEELEDLASSASPNDEPELDYTKTSEPEKQTAPVVKEVTPTNVAVVEKPRTPVVIEHPFVVEPAPEEVEFTGVFNPKYWYVYVIIGLALFLIGMLSFLPLRIIR